MQPRDLRLAACGCVFAGGQGGDRAERRHRGLGEVAAAGRRRDLRLRGRPAVDARRRKSEEPGGARRRGWRPAAHQPRGPRLPRRLPPCRRGARGAGAQLRRGPRPHRAGRRRAGARALGAGAGVQALSSCSAASYRVRRGPTARLWRCCCHPKLLSMRARAAMIIAALHCESLLASATPCWGSFQVERSAVNAKMVSRCRPAPIVGAF
mmetsp:Transcript_95688/g.249472  ORF Transcript_95688/g.249472 Transcript_95688/m.249472 type:complete len:209 (-) Transcript_95688:389-1015(-)